MHISEIFHGFAAHTTICTFSCYSRAATSGAQLTVICKVPAIQLPSLASVLLSQIRNTCWTTNPSRRSFRMQIARLISVSVPLRPFARVRDVRAPSGHSSLGVSGNPATDTHLTDTRRVLANLLLWQYANSTGVVGVRAGEGRAIAQEVRQRPPHGQSWLIGHRVTIDPPTNQH
ncbi:hypothetical protein Aduo_002631 [Ancylostoma duodenale]